jgi:hypothetical protein
MKTAIAYIRVSTQKQGKSGLGLEAQQALIQRFADQEGLQIVETFTEVQSGKDDDQRRPQLSAALKAAPAKTRRYGAIYIIDPGMKQRIVIPANVFIGQTTVRPYRLG